MIKPHSSDRVNWMSNDRLDPLEEVVVGVQPFELRKPHIMIFFCNLNRAIKNTDAVFLAPLSGNMSSLQDSLHD